MEGSKKQSLFRGTSPERIDVDSMDLDVDDGKAPLDDMSRTSTLLNSVEGDQDNLTPIIDEGIVPENIPDATTKETEAKVNAVESTSELPNDVNLLASLPVYYSTSLPSTSSLQIFQYPTYPRDAPLPIPESARSRGLREAIRYRPKAQRVEVELPLDLRPAIYNMDKGLEMAKGANAGGVIGQGSSSKAKREVKKEYGTEEGSSQQRSGAAKRLEKTRLESGLIPHQTQYMVGVIRDKALHLTPVDSILQLRPSMHYLDALDAIAQQEKRRAQAEPGEETDDGSTAEDVGKGSAKAKEKEKKKAQSLSVSIRADSGGGSLGARGKGGVTDSRDLLMLADREAESERWIDLDWIDEKVSRGVCCLDSW
jgi:DNA-directed RNA polymerase-3 subunit RPC5